jgi:hypothetical protein
VNERAVEVTFARRHNSQRDFRFGYVVTFSRRPEGSQTTPGPARWNSRREKIPTSGPASQGADDDCAADSAPVSLVQVRGSSVLRQYFAG